MKSMHGLNKTQYASYLDPARQGISPGSFQSALQYTFWLDNPDALAVAIPPLANTSDATRYTEVYIKKMYTKIIHTNTCNWPCNLEYTYIQARDDIPDGETVQSIMAQDAISIGYPYISPFTGNAFQKRFKILKSKHKILAPNKTCTVRLKKKFRPKPFTGIVQGAGNLYALEKNVLVFVRMWGMPMPYRLNTAPYTMSTGLGPVEIHRLMTVYASYYTMDDVRANSIVLATLPLTIPSNTNASRCYTHVVGNDIGFTDLFLTSYNPTVQPVRTYAQTAGADVPDGGPPGDTDPDVVVTIPNDIFPL